MPKYNHLHRLDTLQNDIYNLVDLSQDIEFWLNFVSFPEDYRKDITGIIVVTSDGDLTAMFLCESSIYYDLSVYYHPLPFYRLDDPNNFNPVTLPVYWQENNPYYCR